MIETSAMKELITAECQITHYFKETFWLWKKSKILGYILCKFSYEGSLTDYFSASVIYTIGY